MGCTEVARGVCDVTLALVTQPPPLTLFKSYCLGSIPHFNELQ